MTMWNAGAEPLAFARPAAQAGDIRRGLGLIDEDEARGVEIELTIEPVLAPLQDVGTVLLCRVRGLFLRSRKVQIVPIEAVTPRSWRSRPRISTIVASGVAVMSSTKYSRCGSSFECRG